MTLDSRLSQAAKTEEVYLHQTHVSRNRHRICVCVALVYRSL